MPCTSIVQPEMTGSGDVRWLDMSTHRGLTWTSSEMGFLVCEKVVATHTGVLGSATCDNEKTISKPCCESRAKDALLTLSSLIAKVWNQGVVLIAQKDVLILGFLDFEAKAFYVGLPIVNTVSPSRMLCGLQVPSLVSDFSTKKQ